MEVEGIERSSTSLEENPFVRSVYGTGVPQVLVKSLIVCVRYFANKFPKRMTLGCLRILAALLAIALPRSLTYVLLYPIFRLVFGNLYPAYASYKAVRTKNVKEYVKWMMYWIVFALFTCAETFTDVFFSFWFPFYYEIKTILVVWLLSPATKGSSILYRRFVHPALIRREAEIDEALTRATEQGYTAILHLGSKSVNYATSVLMQTAIKGGGGLVQHLKKSYSLSDLTGEKEDENRNTSHMHDETDMEVEPRRREHVGRRGYSPRRTQSSSNRVDLYFSEVDIDVRQARPRESTTSLTNNRSSDDISSGYSSEALQSSRSSQADSLVRTSSVGARTRAKPRSTAKKTTEDAGEDTDSNDSPSFKTISLPTPLSLVTPERALEILLLLSRNGNVADYIEFDRGSFVAGNDDSIANTSQSGPKREKDESKSDSAAIAETETIPERATIPERIVDACVASIEAQPIRIQEAEGANDISSSRISSKLPENSAEGTDRTVTDELCQPKFDELKLLLSEARRAVDNIVYAREKLGRSDTGIVDALSPRNSASSEDVVKGESSIEGRRFDDDDVGGPSRRTVKETEDAAADTIEMPFDRWTIPNVSRSNSDSVDRAGRYRKKPAPRVPLARSEEDFDQLDDSLNALKATLVIKTGTLKTFSNSDTTKDVFISRVTDKTKGGKAERKSKRQRTKEGFSKLLTIPKSIFHSAFYRERKASTKTEDSCSDASGSESRSNSIEPRETTVEPSASSRGRNDDRSDNDTSSSSDTYVLAPSNGIDDANEVRKREDVVSSSIEGEDKIESTPVASKPEIGETSESLRVEEKLETEIY